MLFLIITVLGEHEVLGQMSLGIDLPRILAHAVSSPGSMFHGKCSLCYSLLTYCGMLVER